MSLDVPTGGVSVYVHVPFCSTKCAYCDFYSVPLDRDPASGDRVDRYLAAVDTLSVARPLLRDVPTLYIGGGTPTVLGERLPELIERVRAAGAVPRPGAEVTVEANPDSLTAGLVMALAEAGVTRVSLGVQSFDDEVLATLGRCHDASQADRAARTVLDAGLRLSVDLMCGIPGQSDSSWASTLAAAIATGAGHVSVYPLTVEEDTPLAREVASGRIQPPDPDVAAAMMLAAEDTLGSGGLLRYEVANYARPGQEALHNLRYWTGGEYLGLGPGAASMLSTGSYALLGPTFDGAQDPSGRIRFTGTKRLDTASGFLARGLTGAPEAIELLTREEASREDAMLGLRLVEGIDDQLAERSGALPALRSLVVDGLVEHVGGRWRTTRRGWLLGNVVFGRVWNG